MEQLQARILSSTSFNTSSTLSFSGKIFDLSWEFILHLNREIVIYILKYNLIFFKGVTSLIWTLVGIPQENLHIE